MQLETINTKFIFLSNNRKLAYCEFGDPKGNPLFFFHGTPGSRFEPMLGSNAAKRHGIRILSFDRPGCGLSDFQSKRDLLDWTEDMKTVADILNITSFSVMGLSGGGPYALACCHALSDLVTTGILMGSWAPVAEDPILWRAMAPLDRFFGKLSAFSPWFFYAPFSLIGLSAKHLSPKSFIQTLDSSMSMPDKILLADEDMANFFAHDVTEAFQQGVKGPADDAIILYREWGFQSQSISNKIHIHHGTDDRFAPYTYAEYLHQHLPHSTLHAYPGEGHFFSLKIFDKILTDTLE